LARTAAQLRDDGEALDAAAAELLGRAAADTNAELAAAGCGTRPAATQDSPGRNAELAGELDVAVLAQAPAAVRRRTLRTWLTAAGATGLTDLHLRSADDLVGRWRGQGAVALPQRLELVREHGRLRVRTAAWPRAR
jgi:tRNA(Ile)-lysidine synthase